MRRFTHPALASPLAKTAHDWLNQSDKLAGIVRQADELGAWSRDLGACVGPHLAAQLSVTGVRIDDGRATLVVLAASNAVAARLRQSTPSILHALSQRGRNIQTLRVRVRPGGPLHMGDVRPRTKQARLSAAGLTHLAELENDLEESPLKDALRQLLAHHGRR